MRGAAARGAMTGLWVLRHGRSRANAAGVVCSERAACAGLAPEGRVQAWAAGERLLGELGELIGPGGGGSAPALLLASPFARAQETAVEVMLELQANGVPADVETEPALAERWFGELEAGPDSVYESVWEGDSLDPTAAAHGVESVESVAARVRSVLEGPRLASALAAGRPCVLVAHGDALSVLCAVHAASGLQRHREHGLPPAGLRRLLPPPSDSKLP